MSHVRARSDAGLQRLAEQLMVEYAGAVPPGQVLSAVYRANWILSSGATTVPVSARATTLQAVVRRLLPDRLATLQDGRRRARASA